MARMITVENTEARVHCIADLRLKPGAPVADALLPGINEVDAEEWAKALRIPVVQALVKKGILVPEGGKKTDITQLDDDEALSRIGKTVDRALLEKWLAGEKRQRVREAVQAQLETIKPRPPKDDDEGGKK